MRTSSGVPLGRFPAEHCHKRALSLQKPTSSERPPKFPGERHVANCTLLSFAFREIRDGNAKLQDLPMMRLGVLMPFLSLILC